MKKHLFYLSMALITALFSACGNGKKGVFTPTSSGRAYEILVVIDQGLWERPAGRALYDVLDSDVPGASPVGTFIPYYVYFSGKL